LRPVNESLVTNPIPDLRSRAAIFHQDMTLIPAPGRQAKAPPVREQLGLAGVVRATHPHMEQLMPYKFVLAATIATALGGAADAQQPSATTTDIASTRGADCHPVECDHGDELL
jgi:hypothetical protein